MTTLKHIDFEVENWGEFAAGPTVSLGYHAAVLASGPEAHWRLGDTPGQAADDDTGNHPGQYVASLTQGEPGPIRLDDTASTRFEQGYVEITDPGPGSGLKFTTGVGLTIAAWFTPEPPQGRTIYYILGKGRLTETGTDQNWAMRLNWELGNLWRPSFIFRNASDTAWHRWEASQGNSPESDFVFVCITFTFGSPATLRTYVDGAPAAGAWNLGDGSGTPLSNDEGVWIGSGRANKPDVAMRGRIGAVSLWRRQLGADEIRLLHHKGLGL